MMRVERLVEPEEKSFCSTSSVRLLRCAHSRARAPPLMRPLMTRTSKSCSCDWIKPLTLLLFRCFFLKRQHYFGTQLWMNLLVPVKVRLLKDLWPGVMKCSGDRGPPLRIDIRKNRVAQLDGFQFLKLLRRNLTARFKAAPGIQQHTE